MKFLLKISFSIIFSAVVCAQAQTTADSIFLYQQSNLSYQSSKWGITQLHNSNIDKASSLKLNYNYQSGNFRQAQQAEKTAIAALMSEGISTINRFKLFGYFSFSRTWQDSLALSQKGIEDNYTPYYFIAGKAGTFERQKYLGGGIISYNLLKEKLYLGTGIDYLYNSSARSVDPRSLVTTYKIIFSPELAFKFNQNTIGLGAIVGYGDEKVEVGYVNSNFGGSLLYPDRISYLNYGYGYIQINTTNFIRRNTYTGLKLNYSGYFKTWNISGRLNYQVSKEVNQIVKEMALNDETFGTFQLETYNADIILNKNIGNIHHQLAIQASKNTGDDVLVSLNARNYTLKTSDVSLKYSHLKSNKKNDIAWLFNLSLYDFYQRDAAANHTLEYTYIYPKIGSTVYWKMINKDLFSTEIIAGSRLPLNANIVVPSTQVNIFTRGVAYPDYIYWNSKVGELQFVANYTTTRLLNKFRTGITFKSTYLKSFTSTLPNLDATFIPNNNYLDLNFSLNLYF